MMLLSSAKPDDKKSHEPLFALRQHNSAVLCCSFYPTTGSNNNDNTTPSEFLNQCGSFCLAEGHSLEKHSGIRQDMALGYLKEVTTQDIHSSNSHFFLTGDVDGLCILWDLRIRKPVLLFQPVEEAIKHNLNPLLSNGLQNESVLSVGFFPSDRFQFRAGGATVSNIQPHAHQTNKDKFITLSDECHSSNSLIFSVERNSANESVSCVSHTSVSIPETVRSACEPRFSLRRRHVTRDTTIEKSFGNDRNTSETVNHSTRASVSDTFHNCVYFFTLCRNQKLYIWEYSHREALTGRSNDERSYDITSEAKTPGLMLLRIIPTPQLGFCQISCSYARHFVVNKETNADEASRSTRPDVNKSHSVSVSFSSYFAAPYHGEDGNISVWRVDAGMPKGESTSASASFSLRLLSDKDDIIVQRDKEKEWSGEGPGFRLATSFKGGTIMCLYMCRDSCSLAAAFESGHVVLFRFRPRSCRRNVSESNTSMNKFHPHVVAVVRAFPEACVSCLWEERNDSTEGKCNYSLMQSDVIAASADGIIHCYLYCCDKKEKCCSHAHSVSEPEPEQYKWSLQWSHELPNGIGQLKLQNNVILAGCWDSTVRLFSLSTGRIISILTHHKEAVNSLCVFSLPSLQCLEERSHCSRNLGNDEDVLVNRFNEACFSSILSIGSDIRRRSSHLSQRLPYISNTKKFFLTHQKETNDEIIENETNMRGVAARKNNETSSNVLLFASASKDHSVAVWKVDFAVV